MTMSRDWPLAGVRVLDLSTEIAGPYGTKLWVDAGADVIKIELPEGDPLRRWSASHTPIPEGQDGALFQYLNASKRSVVADVRTREGRELVLDLAATADIVVESFGPGEMKRLGLSHAELSARHRALSLVSISPWGQTGPWAHRAATEWTLQAATGSTSDRGLRDRTPVGFGGRIGDWIAGVYAGLGALFAWMHARNTGEGQYVDLSMFEAMFTTMPCFADFFSQLMPGVVSQPRVEIPGIEPAKDGWVGFYSTTFEQWNSFCLLIGRPDFAEDRRFADHQFRMDHVKELTEACHAYTRERTVEEILETATAWRIPCSPVGNGKTIPTIDHLVERKIFVRHPGGFLQPRTPYRLEKTPLRPLGPAPKLGEHTAQIQAERRRTKPAAAPEASEARLPLSGVRVVDFSAFWAGPAVTGVLAQMGADVIKIESIQRPDGMRFATPLRGDFLWETSGVFLGVNSGKRDITLNLDSEEGRALAERLIATADVVVENFSVRVMENFGFTWERLHALNPRLVMLRMPAYGLDGPWRDRPGFAGNVEQVCGLAWVTGYLDRPMILNVCDPVGAMHAVFALLMALEARRSTGEGQLVEATLLEPALNVAAEQVIEYSAYGQLLSRSENRGPYAAPQGVYSCRETGDRIALAVATDEQWRGLVTAMGNPEWARDPSLATAAGRRAAHDAIDEKLLAWLGRMDSGEAIDRLVASGVPAHPLINSYRLMPNPQLEHRQFFQVQSHPYAGTKRYPGFPMRFSGIDTQYRWPPPTLGQHNEEILAGELGLSAEQIETLRQKKVIGERPNHY